MRPSTQPLILALVAGPKRGKASGRHRRRTRRTRRILATVVATMLALVFTPHLASAAVPPSLTITLYDTDTAVVGGTGFPVKSTVKLHADLAYPDGTAYAGDGTIGTDGTGHFLVGFILPEHLGSGGKLTVTATAKGAPTQDVTLSLSAGAPINGPELTPSLQPSASAPAGGAPNTTTGGSTGGDRLRGGTTDLGNTAAYPNAPLIPAPLKIPAGGVSVPAGSDLQSFIDSHGAGTQFNLAAGTFSGPGVIHPKAGDKFYGVKAGPGGTKLVGLGIQRPNGSADNVEIHNISITGYSDSGRNGAIDSNLHESDAASGWKLTNSEIYGNYLGASMGMNSLVENNTFHDNECKGAAGGMDGTIWRYNQFIHNRLPDANDPGGDCGGVKITVETNNQFIGNLFSDNGHPSGLWMDASCHDNTFTNNISYNNDGSGFTDETGYSNTFKNNIAAGNGSNEPDGWRKVGIVIQSSGRDTATGNFAWNNNGASITIYMEDRHDASGTDRTANNTVTNNTVDVATKIMNVNTNGPNTTSGNVVKVIANMLIPRLAAGPQM
ncbi:right-handed parallel beta-helix repeat-containing protein [Pseudofrankia sp. DC12]|uniref:right-handed parallel beta-helix repeat-containing protein n=1 Tax=Pseudofrankia sp. DC12 TaxID=683315 RepID=UPI001E38A245|nr:right-handed parallel beta-helix repeat-containing protein [Pseudofrankia sp. DC12]